MFEDSNEQMELLHEELYPDIDQLLAPHKRKTFWKSRLIGVSVLICLASSFQVYNIAIANNLYPVIEPWLQETVGKNNTERMNWEWSFFASSVSFGKVVGTLLSGFTIDRFGRKPPLYFVCLTLLSGGAISGSTKALGSLRIGTFGRFLIGIGGGFGTSIAQIFLVESAPIHFRGQCFSILNLFYGLGDLLGLVMPAKFLFGTAQLWPICLVIGTLPSTLLLLFLYRIPETPRHLIIRQHNEQKGIDSLIFYHGTDRLEQTIKEMREERDHLEKNAAENVAWLAIFQKVEYLKPLLISMTLNTFLHCSIFLTTLYSTALIEAAGFSTESAIVASILIGVIKFSSGFLNTAIIDRFSRRLLILISSFACTFSIAGMLVTYSFTEPLSQIWPHLAPWLVIAYFIVYNIFYSIVSSAGSLMCLELFLQEARAKTAVIVQGFAWFLGFIFPTFFFPIFKAHGAAVSLAPIVTILFMCSVILWFFIPETKDKTFLDVKKDVSKQKLLHLK